MSAWFWLVVLVWTVIVILSGSAPGNVLSWRPCANIVKVAKGGSSHSVNQRSSVDWYIQRTPGRIPQYTRATFEWYRDCFIRCHYRAPKGERKYESPFIIPRGTFELGTAIEDNKNFQASGVVEVSTEMPRRCWALVDGFGRERWRAATGSDKGISQKGRLGCWSAHVFRFYRVCKIAKLGYWRPNAVCRRGYQKRQLRDTKSFTLFGRCLVEDWSLFMVARIYHPPNTFSFMVYIYHGFPYLLF